MQKKVLPLVKVFFCEIHGAFPAASPQEGLTVEKGRKTFTVYGKAGGFPGRTSLPRPKGKRDHREQ